MHLFDLKGEEHKLLEKYSYGMRRKISLIIPIIIRPKILIFDEPVLGLDAPSIIILKRIIKEHLFQRSTIIFSSHLTDLINNLCDSIAIIHGGKIAYYSDRIADNHIDIDTEYLNIIGLKNTFL